MGISNANYDLITQAMALMKPRIIHVLELGNQHLRPPLQGTAKDLYLSLGARSYRAFDINGQDDSIEIDLNYSLLGDPKYMDMFDLVTNFGTSEHIRNQIQVFSTIFECCTVGGLMLHSLPLVGYWRGHSPYKYRESFPAVLARETNSRLIRKEVVPRGSERLLNFIIEKTPETKVTHLAIPLEHVEACSDYLYDKNNRR